jgi:hypothetical protein
MILLALLLKNGNLLMVFFKDFYITLALKLFPSTMF